MRRLVSTSRRWMLKRRLHPHETRGVQVFLIAATAKS